VTYRKRLEPDFLESSAFDLVPSPSKEITEIDGESDSIVNVEIPPWADDSRMLNGTDEGRVDLLSVFSNSS
jgi:hypothetical protein